MIGGFPLAFLARSQLAIQGKELNIWEVRKFSAC